MPTTLKDRKNGVPKNPFRAFKIAGYALGGALALSIVDSVQNGDRANRLCEDLQDNFNISARAISAAAPLPPTDRGSRPFQIVVDFSPQETGSFLPWGGKTCYITVRP